MGDRMREKVARAMFRQDHDEGWGAGETATKLIYLNNASAALDACHFEELVEALRELHAWSLPFIEKSPISAETQWRRFPKAVEAAGALLAKVKEEGHE